MEITKVKGGRIAKYRYRESMNEKAPEVAEKKQKEEVVFKEGGEKVWSRDDVALRWRFQHV
jgi:hypothetical protein